MDNKNICYECGKESGYHEGFWEVGDVHICNECFDKFYALCDECYAILPKDKIVTLPDGSQFCRDCLSEDYDLCADCGQLVSKKVLVNGVCQMCREYYK